MVGLAIMNFLKYGQSKTICFDRNLSYDSHNNEDVHIIIFNHLGNSLQSRVKRLLYFPSSLCPYTIILAHSPVWMKNTESVISKYHLFKDLFILRCNFYLTNTVLCVTTLWIICLNWLKLILNSMAISFKKWMAKCCMCTYPLHSDMEVCFITKYEIFSFPSHFFV